ATRTLRSRVGSGWTPAPRRGPARSWACRSRGPVSGPPPARRTCSGGGCGSGATATWSGPATATRPACPAYATAGASTPPTGSPSVSPTGGSRRATSGRAATGTAASPRPARPTGSPGLRPGRSTACTPRSSGRRRDGPGPGAGRHPARRPRRAGALLPDWLGVRRALPVGGAWAAASGSGARLPLHLPRHQRGPPPRERTDLMGLYHSVAVAYGFEIPADTDIDHLDRVIGDGPDLLKDSVGHIIVGDYDRLLLVTRYTTAEENAVVRLTADMATTEELAAWDAALPAVAARLDHADHEPPGWLLIHNYR